MAENIHDKRKKEKKSKGQLQKKGSRGSKIHVKGLKKKRQKGKFEPSTNPPADFG